MMNNDIRLIKIYILYIYIYLYYYRRHMQMSLHKYGRADAKSQVICAFVFS